MKPTNGDYSGACARAQVERGCLCGGLLLRVGTLCTKRAFLLTWLASCLSLLRVASCVCLSFRVVDRTTELWTKMDEAILPAEIFAVRADLEAVFGKTIRAEFHSL